MPLPILALALLAGPGQPGVLPADLYLVRATVVEVRQKEYPIQLAPGVSPYTTRSSYTQPVSVLRIDHVYLGPASLKGQDFRYEQGPFHFSGPQSGRNDVSVEAPPKGTEGLWWVRSRQPTDDDKTPFEAEVREEIVVANRIAAFPIQKVRIPWTLTGADLARAESDYQRAEWVRKHTEARAELQARSDTQYRDGLAWADAVEKVSRAGTADDRLRLLRGYATKKSALGAWAVAWLGQSADPASLALLRELATDRALPLTSHLAIDATLTHLDGYRPELKWVGSEARLALHERWRDLKRNPAAEPGLADPRARDEMDRLLR